MTSQLAFVAVSWCVDVCVDGGYLGSSRLNGHNDATDASDFSTLGYPIFQQSQMNGSMFGNFGRHPLVGHVWILQGKHSTLTCPTM